LKYIDLFVLELLTFASKLDLGCI